VQEGWLFYFSQLVSHPHLSDVITTLCLGFACTENCHGRMVQEFDELALHTQLKCLEALFDVPRLQAKRKLNDVAYVLCACVCHAYGNCT
jgi:hypothetical protein